MVIICCSIPRFRNLKIEMESSDGRNGSQSVRVAVNVRPLVTPELLVGCSDCISVTPGEPQVISLTLAYLLISSLLRFVVKCFYMLLVNFVPEMMRFISELLFDVN